MKRKWKILLHSMTFKRDFGSLYVLSKLLEHLGCECFVSSDSNYFSTPLKLWNPDAVVYVTLSRTERIVRAFPFSKLFLWTGEGGENYEYSSELIILRSKSLFDRISRAYLWGERGKEHIIRAMGESGAEPFMKDMLLVEDKFPIMANPRIDLIRYSQRQPIKTSKIKIGLLGLFYNINSPIYAKISLLGSILLNIESETVLVSEDAKTQINLLKCYYNIVKMLDSDKYEFSLRPYPLEPVDQYMSNPYFKEGKVKLDNSIDFSTWMNAQDIIIGMTSSSICQIAMAKKPFVNLDVLCERSKKCLDLIPEELVRASHRNSPTSQDDLFNMIWNFGNYKLAGPEIENYLDKLYHSKIRCSANLSVAKDIIGYLEKTGIPGKSLLPLPVASIWDDLRMRYIEYRNRDNMGINYSHFRRSKIFPQARREFDPVVENILNSPENTELIGNG